MKSKCKILIYGTGVIGSIYAMKLSIAGHDVYVYARGSRLQSLKNKGLLYYENGSVLQAPVKVIEMVNPTDNYDYIFVPIKYTQIETALTELAAIACNNIITMVNNPKGYFAWESIIGKGKLIPAFAGAGGKIENDVLYYAFTPKIIQTTTFGEVDGTITDRLYMLADIFKSCHIPYSISKNMDAWQKSHIALVVPLANAIYFDGGDNYSTARNVEAIRMMSVKLKTNFNGLKAKGIPIVPLKMHIFRLCPLWIMRLLLKIFCSTKLAGAVSSHVPYIKDEMSLLEKEFDELINM